MPQERHRRMRARRTIGAALAVEGLLATSTIGGGTVQAQDMATP